MMSSHSLAQTKNFIRKALWKLLDPDPPKSQVDSLWLHFGRACAYCGRILTREERKGHLDHLESSAELGRNHISNRVLACNLCNGDEKREIKWEHFLRSKCSNEEIYQARKMTIEKWRESCGPAPIIDEKLRSTVQESIERCTSVLDEEYKRLRTTALGNPGA